MKKRIVCFVLTLIMLIGLVPVSAIPAAAASNAIGENGITILKNLEGGYSKYCKNGFIGYGEKCPECKGVNRVDCKYKSTPLSEKQADKNLRDRLKDLDKAVNNFADKNGLSFSQAQHDALVIFSFENGTAWTLGTGEFQTAIKSGYTGSRFLDAICKWEYSILDDNRRMVEANMYLNGVYSSERPSRFIRVKMDPQEEYGFLYENNEEHLHYFDVASPVTITLTPSPKVADNTFLGWYMEKEEDGEIRYVRVTTLTSAYHDADLIARYQNDTLKAGETFPDILYTLKKSALSSTTVYVSPEGTKVTTYINYLDKEVTIKLGDTLYVVNDFIDSKGGHWALVADRYEDEAGIVTYYPMGWVKVKGTGSSINTGLGMDVTVTVTNTYVNMRKNASINSAKNGSFNLGDTLRIINTKNGSDGFLWGQVAASADDDTAIGWVALMYTDYDSVIAGANASAPEKSVATATIVAPVNGYVNVRSDAGINNQIVGALSYGVTVELYETKYVNGIQWGRCSTGWFCLTYALVSGLDTNAGTGEAGFTNYIYVVTLTEWTKGMTVMDNGVYEFYYAPNQTPVEDAYEKDAKGEFVLDKEGNKILTKITSNQLKIGKLRAYEVGDTIETWAYTPYGWLKINEHSKSADELDSDGMINVSFEAKYYAIGEDVTVRTAPKSSASRVNILIKGVEFNVHEIVMVNESIWGYAEKEGRIYDKETGEDVIASYEGWINLSNQNVSRNANDDYKLEDSTASSGTTVKMARVVGTDSLRVRNTGASYGTVIGSLSNGTTAVVLDEKNGWYLLDIDVDNNPATGSWCSGSYLELYDEVQGGSTGNSGTSTGSVETGLGMVANTYTGVNIRSGAGTAYPATGKYMTGTTVEILEVKTVGSSKWGRTEKGWVCMDYIAMVDKYNPNGTGSTGNSTTTSSNVVIYTGEINTDNVIVYSNTNTVSDDGTGVGGSQPVGAPVRVLNAGDPVTVHELIVQVEYDEPDEALTKDENDGKDETIRKRTTYWARVNEGYIYAPGTYIDLYALDEHVYTVAAAKADVYEDSDLKDEKAFDFAKGTKLYVTQLQIVRNEVACYAEDANSLNEGWVSLATLDKGFASSTEPEVEEEEENNTTTEPTGPSYIQGSTGNTGGSVSASGYKYTGKVINTNQVNVRATASTTANVTTTLKNGASLVIYETVISEFMAWGRCDSGWVYLYYVDLTPVGSGAVDARVVYNDNTVIYKDMGMSEATGSTYAKMAVVDIYEIVGKMARTDMGWIHTDNLL